MTDHSDLFGDDFSTFAKGHELKRGPDTPLPTTEDPESPEYLSRPQITDPREYRRMCVDVDPLNILREFTEISSHHAYWGHHRAKARALVSHAKIDRDEAEAQLKLETARLQLSIRESLIGNPELAETVCGTDAKGKPKKPTDAIIEAKILLHDDYQMAEQAYFAAQRELIDAEVVHAQLDVTCKAVAVKQESLVQIGADRRAELKTDPSLRRMASDIRSGDDPG